MTTTLLLTTQYQALHGIVVIDGDYTTICIPLTSVKLDDAEAMLEKALHVIRTAKAVNTPPAVPVQVQT